MSKSIVSIAKGFDPEKLVAALIREVRQAERIINLPIFKSHCSMVFTCALKNMKGVVQDKVHYQMHQTNLAEAMMDLWTVIRPDLNIADLIRPAEGFGPHTTLPVDRMGKETPRFMEHIHRLEAIWDESKSGK